MSLWIETISDSKCYNPTIGQARMSLWIETSAYKKAVEGLLRSGSYEPVDRNHNAVGYGAKYIGQARMSLWIETLMIYFLFFPLYGQARMSLWIETPRQPNPPSSSSGQARMSLWIETPKTNL